MSPLAFSALVLVIGICLLWGGLKLEDRTPCFDDRKHPVLSLLEYLLTFSLIWLGFGVVLLGGSTTLFLLLSLAAR